MNLKYMLSTESLSGQRTSTNALPGKLTPLSQLAGNQGAGAMVKNGFTVVLWGSQCLSGWGVLLAEIWGEGKRKGEARARHMKAIFTDL